MRPLLWTVGRTGGKIIRDIAHNKSPDVSAEVISKHFRDAVTETTRRFVSKLRGQGLKRSKTPKRRGGKKTPANRSRVIIRDIFP